MKTLLMEPKIMLVNRNIRYLAKLLGGVPKMQEVFDSHITESTLYSYTRKTEPMKPNTHFCITVAEHFGLPLEDLYYKDLERGKFKYTPSVIPTLKGDFIGGKNDYSYRAFQIIDMLQRKYGKKSLRGFVNSLKEYKKSYTTFTNVQLGRQKVTSDMFKDMKNVYPEINMNYIFTGEGDPFIASESQISKSEIETLVNKLVDERLKKN